jgi:hypothetical protein
VETPDIRMSRKDAIRCLIEMAFELDRLAIRCQGQDDYTVNELRIQLERMASNVAALAARKREDAA